VSDRAFIGIIENGDALADISADIGGKLHGYNSVHGDFEVMARDGLSLKSNHLLNTINILQSEISKGDIQIRYGFLQGDQANYAGMAEYYRNYLVAKHGLKKLSGSEDIPFYLELTGDIPKRKSFLGIPYDTLETLTDYAQAKEIIEKLKEEHITDIKLKYTGWFNKGVNHTIPTGISLDRGVGNKEDWNGFVQYLKENKIGFYPDVALLNVYNDTSGQRRIEDAVKRNCEGVRLQSGNVQAKFRPSFALRVIAGEASFRRGQVFGTIPRIKRDRNFASGSSR
jgi:hypothetical protein